MAGRWGTERGPVIGREAEVAVLADFLAAGRDTPQALALDGEAGIGKTTLFDAALAEAREQGVRGLLLPSGGCRDGVLVRCAC